jgi:hypothetical protein
MLRENEGMKTEEQADIFEGRTLNKNSAVYKKFNGDEKLNPRPFLRNKKLAKYFNRETAAAVICSAELLQGYKLRSDTPFYYCTAEVEHEDYGLPGILKESLEEKNSGLGFSAKNFIGKGMGTVSPLTQFKVLLNMPLCFVSIEQELHGDNAVLYSDGVSFADYLDCAESGQEILLGAGKVHSDNTVESCFVRIFPESWFNILENSSDKIKAGIAQSSLEGLSGLEFLVFFKKILEENKECGTP